MPAARTAVAVATLVAAALAQSQKIVSPTNLATVDGASYSPLPWFAPNAFQPARWLAIHSDIGGRVRTLSALAFRRDAAAPPQPATRTLDLELVVGESVPFDRPSWEFARNWIGAPTTVLPRQLVNVGALTGTGSPPPFDLRFFFATPVVYGGVNSIAYELRVHAVTGAATCNLDAVQTSALGGFPGLPQGQGCNPTGSFFSMKLGIAHHEVGSTYCFGAYVTDAPTFARTVLAFGSTNPNLPVPGLCSNLLTDLLAVVDIGTTDVNGRLAEWISAGTTTFYFPTGSAMFAMPNTFANAQFYVQAHAFDALSTSGIPITNSNGYQVYVPPLGPTAPPPVTSIFTIVPNPAHPSALLVTPNIGYGLVAEFTWQ